MLCHYPQFVIPPVELFTYVGDSSANRLGSQATSFPNISESETDSVNQKLYQHFHLHTSHTVVWKYINRHFHSWPLKPKVCFHIKLTPQGRVWDNTLKSWDNKSWDNRVTLNRKALMGLEGCSWLVNSVHLISHLHQHLEWELTVTKLSVFSSM